MVDSNADKSAENVSSPSSPEQLEDLTPKLSEADQSSVVGGRKAGGTQQEYLKVTMEDLIISS